jgi:two-component system sensor histidine kinase UhpB
VLLKALVRAQEDERARLARELHDGAGQTLTSLLMRLSALENKAASDVVRQQLRDLCQKMSGTIEQVRDIAYRLRPPELEEFGLEVAIKSLVEEVATGAGLTADCQLSLGGQRLPFEVETTLYRIAQESLTNIVRHAAAHRITVELFTLPYAACLRIADDGRGFDPETDEATSGKRRLGLLSLRERAEMLGGALTVRSAPGAGTTVEVRLPGLLETEAEVDA